MEFNSKKIAIVTKATMTIFCLNNMYLLKFVSERKGDLIISIFQICNSC